jgi:hypothetical protein
MITCRTTYLFFKLTARHRVVTGELIEGSPEFLHLFIPPLTVGSIRRGVTLWTIALTLPGFALAAATTDLLNFFDATWNGRSRSVDRLFHMEHND